MSHDPRPHLPAGTRAVISGGRRVWVVQSVWRDGHGPWMATVVAEASGMRGRVEADRLTTLHPEHREVTA